MTEDQVNLQTAWEKVLSLDKELEHLRVKHTRLIQEYADFRHQVEHYAQRLLSVANG